MQFLNCQLSSLLGIHFGFGQAAFLELSHEFSCCHFPSSAGLTICCCPVHLSAAADVCKRHKKSSECCHRPSSALLPSHSHMQCCQATSARMVTASFEITVHSCQARASSATARLPSSNQQPCTSKQNGSHSHNLMFCLTRVAGQSFVQSNVLLLPCCRLCG